MRAIEEPYLIPPGKIDFPYIYIFDASNLTDGLTYQNLQVRLDGDSDFILRSIIGVPRCIDTFPNGGRWAYYNESKSYAMGNPSTGIGAANNWPVLPEKVYTLEAGEITFDLYTVLRSVSCALDASPVYDSQIGWRGVKRLPLNAGYPPQKSSYQYREIDWTYVYPLTLDWEHLDPLRTRRYIQQMEPWDFELLQVLITRTDGVPAPTTGLVTDDFSITLYDPNLHSMSNVPVPQSFINSAKPTPQTQQQYQSCFPAPSVLYPVLP